MVRVRMAPRVGHVQTYNATWHTSFKAKECGNENKENAILVEGRLMKKYSKGQGTSPT